MIKDNKFFDDVSKIASTAFASAASMRRDLSSYIRQYVEGMIKNMDFVTRDELEVVKAMLLRVNQELQDLRNGNISEPTKKKVVKKAMPKSKTKV